MPAIYTKAAMIERVKRHMVNNFTNDDFSISDNELLLYIDSAVASSMIANTYGNAKLQGEMAVAEAWYVTNALTLVQDVVNFNWYATLPHPPASLPLGYSVSDLYFVDADGTQSDPVLLIEAKRNSYRRYLPMPNGIRASFEGSKVIFTASNGIPLQDMTPYITMVSTRTTDVNAPMEIPDDALDLIFDSVVKRLVQRLGFPMDTIEDSLPAGNKTS